MAISKDVIMHRDPKARQADEACVLITMAPLAVNMTAPAARMGTLWCQLEEPVLLIGTVLYSALYIHQNIRCDY